VGSSRPSLHIGSVLGPQGAALYPQTLSKCLPQLDLTNSFGGLAPAQIFKSGANLASLDTALGKNDPEHLKITTPLFIGQGTADTTVFKQFTDALDQELAGRGTKIEYKTYAGVTHGGIPAASDSDALAFARKEIR
jgi:dienelactone hydrolase